MTIITSCRKNPGEGKSERAGKLTKENAWPPLGKRFCLNLATPLQPNHALPLPWTCTNFQPHTNSLTCIQHIRNVLQEYADNTVCLSARSKSRIKTVYVYSADGILVSYWVRNIAFISTAELSHFHPSLSTSTKDSLSSLHSYHQPPHSKISLHRITFN